MRERLEIIMNKQEYIDFWVESSKHDMKYADDIFISKKFDLCLFLGHLALEKILKALWIKNNEINIPPRTHNLLKIAREANYVLDEGDNNFLITVTDFNLETRYPDYKFAFYKKCTEEYSKHYLDKIKEFYQCTLKKILE